MNTKQKLDTVLNSILQIEYETRVKNRRHRILLFLNDNLNHRYKPIEIAKSLGIKQPTTRQQLAILLYADLVQVNEFRTYKINSKGIEFCKTSIQIGKKIKSNPSKHN